MSAGRDLGYDAVMGRAAQILRAAAGIDYADSRLGRLEYDYEGLMAATGYSLNDVAAIQRKYKVGDTPLIEALATLAYDGRRGDFFESQLLAALEIVQSGDVEPGRMTGSWAGAMGHTQFIPTSYLSFAVDFTGDGRRDIWGEDPTDALASTAAYLAKSGWTHGLPWGMEVTLPGGFNTGLLGRGKGKSVALAIDGGQADLRRSRFGKASAKAADSAPMAIALDQLQISDGIRLNGFSGQFSTNGGFSGDFTASVNAKAPIRGAVATAGNGHSAFRIEADDQYPGGKRVHL